MTRNMKECNSSINLHGDGHKPKPLGTPGVEKSSNSSLKITPVIGSITCEPNTRFTVEVIETANPDESTTDVCDCQKI